MMALSGVVVFCLAGILGSRYAAAYPVFPVTADGLKSEMNANMNKMNEKITSIAEGLKPYLTMEQEFALVGTVVLRLLRQNLDERFGSTEEEITKTFQKASQLRTEVGLVGPYLDAAQGEVSRLLSWKNTAFNNLDAQSDQPYQSFASLPYFCRKFFTRTRCFDRLIVYLAAAQQKTNKHKAEIRDACAKLAKLLEYLEKHFKEETKQARNYVNEVWNKEIQVIIKAETYMEDNADMQLSDALAKARGVIDDGASKLRAGYDWVREDEYFFNCAPFNGHDVFQAAKESLKESGAFVGISKGGYIAIANTVVLLIAYSIWPYTCL